MKNLVIPHGFETNYAVGFVRGLAANGVPFTVLSDDGSAARLDAAGIPHRNIRGSLETGRSKAQKALNLVRYYVALLWQVVRHRGGTLHFTGLLGSRIILLDGVLLPLWFRLWAGRYIHTAHNALPHSRERSRFFRFAYRWIYRFPHVILAHTEKVRHQLETEFGVDPSRIVVISIGLNEEVPLATVSRAEARRQLGLPERGPLVLCFGKVERYKGIELLADAWGQVRAPDTLLRIVGWCADTAYAAEVRAAMARSPRAATMAWKEGFVPNEEVALWLAACDVVAMPYRNIYQSGVIFLCLRFGVPIVATDVGSRAEYILPDSGVVAPPGDAAAFAAALDRFFSHAGEYRREDIARRAAKYNWAVQCAAIKHLYA